MIFVFVYIDLLYDNVLLSRKQQFFRLLETNNIIIIVCGRDLFSLSIIHWTPE